MNKIPGNVRALARCASTYIYTHTYIQIDKRHTKNAGFEVLTSLLMKSTVLWNVKPFGPLKVNQTLRRKISLPSSESKIKLGKKPDCKQVARRAWTWNRCVLQKRLLTFNGLHGVISQKVILQKTYFRNEVDWERIDSWKSRDWFLCMTTVLYEACYLYEKAKELSRISLNIVVWNENLNQLNCFSENHPLFLNITGLPIPVCKHAQSSCVSFNCFMDFVLTFHHNGLKSRNGGCSYLVSRVVTDSEKPRSEHEILDINH
jgi:hypothetical protein